jgi:spore coat protein U-like protein
VALLIAEPRALAAQTCGFVGTVGINFGFYDFYSPVPLDSTGRISFVCSGLLPGEPITVMISRGEGVTFLPRTMKGRNHSLDYNLYLDAARTFVWGDGSAGSSTFITRPPDGATVTVDVFARIPPRQSAAAGAYRDTVLVTLLY